MGYDVEADISVDSGDASLFTGTGQGALDCSGTLLGAFSDEGEAIAGNFEGVFDGERFEEGLWHVWDPSGELGLSGQGTWSSR